MKYISANRQEYRVAVIDALLRDNANNICGLFPSVIIGIVSIGSFGRINSRLSVTSTCLGRLVSSLHAIFELKIRSAAHCFKFGVHDKL